MSAHTYEWYKKNKQELFDDMSELLDLYEKTDKFKQDIAQYVEKKTKDFVNYRDLQLGYKNIFKFSDQ